MKKESWKKIINFVIELLKLLLSAFLGGTAAINL